MSVNRFSTLQTSGTVNGPLQPSTSMRVETSGPPLLLDPMLRKVVVFRALLLGDMLCAIPALRALRAAAPKAHVALVGLPWARNFISHFPKYVDEFLEFPGFPGLPEREPDLDALPDFLRALKQRRFDLAIQLHGSGSIVNPLVACFGARTSAGYTLPDAFCSDSEGFIHYPVQVPEIWKHLTLMRHLGATELDDSLEFPLRPQDMPYLQRTLRERGIDGQKPIACLHPGTKAAWRCWQPANFAYLGDALGKLGYTVAVTGTAAEKPLVDAVIARMSAPAVDLAGAFPDIGPLAALLRQCRLLVCGDTGLSHLACAVKCPSVVLFMRSELQGWPPLDRQRHRVVASINGVQPEHVLRECLDLLKTTEDAVYTALP